MSVAKIRMRGGCGPSPSASVKRPPGSTLPPPLAQPGTHTRISRVAVRPRESIGSTSADSASHTSPITEKTSPAGGDGAIIALDTQRTRQSKLIRHPTPTSEIATGFIVPTAAPSRRSAHRTHIPGFRVPLGNRWAMRRVRHQSYTPAEVRGEHRPRIHLGLDGQPSIELRVHGPKAGRVEETNLCRGRRAHPASRTMASRRRRRATCPRESENRWPACSPRWGTTAALRTVCRAA